MTLSIRAKIAAALMGIAVLACSSLGWALLQLDHLQHLQDQVGQVDTDSQGFARNQIEFERYLDQLAQVFGKSQEQQLKAQQRGEGLIQAMIQVSSQESESQKESVQVLKNFATVFSAFAEQAVPQATTFSIQSAPDEEQIKSTFEPFRTAVATLSSQFERGAADIKEQLRRDSASLTTVLWAWIVAHPLLAAFGAMVRQ